MSDEQLVAVSAESVRFDQQAAQSFGALKTAYDNAFAVCKRWCEEFGIFGFGHLTEISVYDNEVCFKGMETWARGGYGPIEVDVPALAFDDFDAAVAYEKQRRESRRLYLLNKAEKEREREAQDRRAKLLSLAEQIGAVVHFPDEVQ